MNKGIKNKKSDQPWKLTTELLVIMTLSALFSLSCLLFLYTNRYQMYDWALRNNLVSDQRDEFIRHFSQEAPKYELYPTGPVDEADREMVDSEYLPLFFENRDPYLGFSIYDNETGKYVTGYMPEIMSKGYLGAWIRSNTTFFSQQGEWVETNVTFKDCTALLIVESFRVVKIFPVYLGGTILLCVGIFLIPVLVFVQKRMAYLGLVRKEALMMAGGDLAHPITVTGKDEMAALARELDYLRSALGENIEKERKSYAANRELIRAVSHDLRTPLTTLYGYLEILKNGKGRPEKYPEYLERCLAKTREIRGMSDKVFEYALVSDGEDKVDKQPLSLEVLWKALREQAEYLGTGGFQVKLDITEKEGRFMGNPFLLSRLINNLFSNILRYGEKSAPVSIEEIPNATGVEIRIQNGVRAQKAAAGSGVGLKSASRIAVIHGGSLIWKEEGGFFQVSLWIPVSKQA